MSVAQGEEVGPMAMELSTKDPIAVVGKHARSDDDDTGSERAKKLRMVEPSNAETSETPLSQGQNQTLTTTSVPTTSNTKELDEASARVSTNNKKEENVNLIEIPVETTHDKSSSISPKHHPVTNRVSLSPIPVGREHHQGQNEKSVFNTEYDKDGHQTPTVAFKSHSPSAESEPAQAQPVEASLAVGFWGKGKAMILAILVVLLGFVAVAGFSPLSILNTVEHRIHSEADETFFRENPHILPPAQSAWKKTSPQWSTLGPSALSNDVTLRSFLQDTQSGGFSLGMAPAFFGFYGYFGVLAAWDEHLSVEHDNRINSSSSFLRSGLVRRLAGASAGAMAAVLLAAGIPPRVAADFCATITLDRFADFPGLFGLFKGNLFEKTMQDFLEENIGGNSSSLLLENAQFPVAVTAFDLQSMEGKILATGSMARAARASATFPLLFEPVGWRDSASRSNTSGAFQDIFTLIDGGIGDVAGIAALESLHPKQQAGERIVNLKIDQFYFGPPSPTEIENCREIVSISIQNLPECGPFALENGPVAVQAAYDAMVASLDLPMYVTEFTNTDKSSNDQTTRRHYELHINASKFWKD